MATITNGILDPFTGIVGPVCGYSRNGKHFMRSRRRKTSSPMTPRRLAQQQKIKVCNQFTHPFSGRKFFNKTFPAYGHSAMGLNRATSAILNFRHSCSDKRKAFSVERRKCAAASPTKRIETIFLLLDHL